MTALHLLERPEPQPGNLQIFSNPEFGQVRAVEINGEPWLVGRDVALALGYTNPRKALIDHVDDEDKNTVTIRYGIRGNPNMTVINQSGLYSLFLSSKLPNARQVKHWVTSEVLPSIQRHGAYMTPGTLDKMISSPEFGIKLLTALKEEQNKRKALEAQAEENKPKVLFAEAVSASEDSILVQELAKLLKQNGVNIGRNRLFEWLRENGYLIKSGSDYNMPTQKAMELGLFEIMERTITAPNGEIHLTRTTKVSGKGQQYFINKFLSKARKSA